MTPTPLPRHRDDQARAHLRRSILTTLVVLGVHVGVAWLLSQQATSPPTATAARGQQIVEVTLNMVAPTSPSRSPATAPERPQVPITRPKPASPTQVVTTPTAAIPAQPLMSRPLHPEASMPPPAQSTTVQPPPAPLQGAPASATSAPAAVTAPRSVPAMVLPSSQADYLHNPAPEYPMMSRRLREQGTVVVRVLIDTEGRAQEAEVKTSSHFDRLDRTALETVRQWRYVPGQRHGVPTAMWVEVPIQFVLE